MRDEERERKGKKRGKRKREGRTYWPAVPVVSHAHALKGKHHLTRIYETTRRRTSDCKQNYLPIDYETSAQIPRSLTIIIVSRSDKETDAATSETTWDNNTMRLVQQINGIAVPSWRFIWAPSEACHEEGIHLRYIVVVSAASRFSWELEVAVGETARPVGAGGADRVEDVGGLACLQLALAFAAHHVLPAVFRIRWHRVRLAVLRKESERRTNAKGSVTWSRVHQ